MLLIGCVCLLKMFRCCFCWLEFVKNMFKVYKYAFLTVKNIDKIKSGNRNTGGVWALRICGFCR